MTALKQRIMSSYTESHAWIGATGTAVNATVTNSGRAVVGVASTPVAKNVEAAVYAHIRAVRALGRTRINTAEIANSLGITIDEVHSVLTVLKKKGIRIAFTA